MAEQAALDAEVEPAHHGMAGEGADRGEPPCANEKLRTAPPAKRIM